MFKSKSWATAFINSVEHTGGDIEEALNTLITLAKRLSDKNCELASPLQETAVRFFLLVVEKKRIRFINSIIAEIINAHKKKLGIISVSAEYAFPQEDEFESILCETIKKRTGASGVEIKGQVKPELIGGYRLRIGDDIIDASIRGQLKKMKASLAAEDGVS